MKAVVIHAAGDLRIEDQQVAPLGVGDIRVGVRAGGICGSDLHYYQHGGFGAVRLCEAMVLGHEVAGVVEAVGEGVISVGVGDHVAINPSLPCEGCDYCLAGLPNHCTDMRFYGSAMRNPHVQGAFRQALVCKASQAVKVPAALSFTSAAFGEPLAVCLHDLLDEPLAILERIGVDRVHNVATRPEALAPYRAGKGYFDAVFEASGSQSGLAAAIEMARPRGVIVQIGLGGDLSVPMGKVVAKELELKGSFRFHEEFAWAVGCIASGAIDVGPLLTAVMPMEEADAAFKLAGDRRRSMKVQITF
jgi:L-idonate 5-dehydrogenase